VNEGLVSFRFWRRKWTQRWVFSLWTNNPSCISQLILLRTPGSVKRFRVQGVRH